MPEKRVFESPEDRIFLAADFDGDFNDMGAIINSLGQRVHAVKVGLGFLLLAKRLPTQLWLRDKGISIFCDVTTRENIDQASFNTAQFASQGFEFKSVDPSAGVERLEAAARAAGSMTLVAVLSESDGPVNPQEIEHIQAVNEIMPEGQGITAIMGNLRQLPNTYQLDGILRVATGIYLPDDNPHDQPAVGTPCEALSYGADMLAIGRAVTAAENKEKAFNLILENMQSESMASI